MASVWETPNTTDDIVELENVVSKYYWPSLEMYSALTKSLMVSEISVMSYMRRCASLNAATPESDTSRRFEIKELCLLQYQHP